MFSMSHVVQKFRCVTHDRFFNRVGDFGGNSLYLHPLTFNWSMIIVNIKENESIDKALKRFKKKFEKTGVLKELRSRTSFEKPSVRRRNEIIRARYRELQRRNEMG